MNEGNVREFGTNLHKSEVNKSVIKYIKLRHKLSYSFFGTG